MRQQTLKGKKKSVMRAEKKISQGTKFEFFKTLATYLEAPLRVSGLLGSHACNVF